MNPICRNITTNDLYCFEGGNTFTNIRTGRSGEINNELAGKVLKINVEATTLINEFPIISELIKSLNLKFEK